MVRKRASKGNRRFSRNPAYTTLLSNWRELVDKQTPSELAFERELVKRGERYRFQHLIWRYIVDFTFPDLKVGIELDGETHDSPEAREKDAARDAWLTKQGWKIYRFRNEDAALRAGQCLDTIKELF